MDEIKDPRYIVGYLGYDYKNISEQFLNRNDIKIVDAINVYEEDLNDEKISSFMCEMEYFKEEKDGYSNILYDLISSNKIDGVPIIGIQREDTTQNNIDSFNNFVNIIDSEVNDSLRTPSIRCPIDVVSGEEKVRDYSIIRNAVEANQILRSNEYKNSMNEIKDTVKELKDEYLGIFSDKVRETIKENRDKTKDEIKKYITMSIISTVSVMAIEMGKEVEEQIGKQDEYTKGHVNSTSAIANMIANELSKNDEILAQYIKEKNSTEKNYEELDEKSKAEYKAMLFNDVSAAGLLHDAGKIAIAMHKYPKKDENGKTIGHYSLLDAPRRLSNEEFAVIQTHPDIGYNILMEVANSVEKEMDNSLNIDVKESLRMIGEGILYHHERVDGKGYHGITNDKFPVVAKIIQTADIYDALISERAYKFAWPDEFARAEMRREAGKQCDTKYLEALDKIIEIARENENTKTEFSNAIGRKNLVWDVRDISDEDKINTLMEIERRNDARMGKGIKFQKENEQEK